MKNAALTLAAVLALVLTASDLGDDFSQGKGAKATTNWKVFSLDCPATSLQAGPGFRRRCGA